jgi:pyruvate dehydrogenase E2 component (dihydrolipoamide acetyltransferase)
MAKIIGLPKLSPTMEEGTLVSWAKKEGDAVEIDDLLAEVETDKATMEFRSFDKGVLLKLLANEGDTLAPDAPVAIIGKEGEDISELVEKAKSGGGAPASSPAPDEKKEAKQGEKKEAKNDEGNGKQAAPAKRTEKRSDGRVLASPLVRRIAREKDIDLAEIEGSGPKGRIVKRDVEGVEGGAAPQPAAARAAAPGGVAPKAPGTPHIVKVSQMRKTIARRLTESKRDIPHYYLTIDVDAEPLMAFRKDINAELERDGEKISVNDLLIKACAVALRRYPAVNASFMDKEIHYHGRVDISVAVAIPDGLITPVVRDADVKGVAEIAREVRELAERARAKKLEPEEFTNGTFSISNLGMYGIEHFTAVINPPEAAILAVGTIRDEPVVKGSALVPGKRMRMTMSCDHRVVDGAVGAEFLALLKRLIEKPAALII